MLFRLKLRMDAFHKPTETWHVHETAHGLNAVSRKHALDKGLKVLKRLPGYADRDGHPDWIVAGEVKILDAEL